VRLPNGRLGRKYLKPGSEREQAARAALARLIRKGSPFPGFIRETLAALFDPASATVPAGRRIDFIDQKQNRPKEGFDVALHVWFRWKLGDKKEAAVASAMKGFGLGRRRVFEICRAWPELEALREAPETAVDVTGGLEGVGTETAPAEEQVASEESHPKKGQPRKNQRQSIAFLSLSAVK
jgi:hypothetical protein